LSYGCTREVAKHSRIVRVTVSNKLQLKICYREKFEHAKSIAWIGFFLELDIFEVFSTAVLQTVVGKKCLSSPDRRPGTAPYTGKVYLSQASGI